MEFYLSLSITTWNSNGLLCCRSTATVSIYIYYSFNMQQYYNVNMPTGSEVWGLIVTRCINGLEADFQCPKCYCLVRTLGGSHNCPVPIGEVYQCLRCDKDIFPPHTFLMDIGLDYYVCYWCNHDIKNSIWRQLQHSRRCSNKPPEGCQCPPVTN